MKIYYNEFDPKAAAWLRELIARGQIPAGDVDTRSIVDVKPDDLYEYDQCHFFAGIGGWPLALQLAGWSGPVWTGSCPCQPFSVAGKGLGTSDERHLWPQFARLIAKCRPPVVFGEQVASKAGREWLAGVRADLEGMVYAVGAADLCAAGVGAPHIRQRLYWGGMDNTPGDGRKSRSHIYAQHDRQEPVDGCRLGWVGISDSAGRDSWEPTAEGSRHRGSSKSAGGPRRVEYATGDGRVKRGSQSGGWGAPGGREPRGMEDSDGRDSGPGRTKRGREHRQLSEDARTGFWSDYELIPCRDGKARRIEPGTFPLAHGVPGRVGLLRGYGNAIVPEVAAEFITAFQLAAFDFESCKDMPEPDDFPEP